MTRVLAVESAAKRFGETEALRGVDLTVDRGEWVGLLGPNGAGKTTLVRSLAGRVTLDAGRASILGSDISSPGEAREARRRVGIVPQEIAIYPKLTARENLDAFGALHGLDRATRRERVGWALEWTGLAERGSARAETFSGGMKRRLNLACSVLHRPELLLLDEPTVGVDPQSRERIWEMLAELQREGATLVLTTHQLDEAQQVCERIVIIDHGVVIASGTLDELVARTIGSKRQVILRLAGAIDSIDGEGVELDHDGRTVRFRTDDVAGRLARLSAAVGERGGEILDVEVRSPSLHSVFLHLTGRELRE